MANNLGKLVLIMGGARSGKSRLAEELAISAGGKVTYLATAPIFDDEMAHRVKLHKERRPSNWATVEEPHDLMGALDKIPEDTEIVLLDCLTLWLTNRLLINYDEATPPASFDVIEDSIRIDLDKFCQAILQKPYQTLIVANEVGCGIVPESLLGRVFRDIAGRANQQVAQFSSTAYYVVAGYPITLKGGDK